MFRHRDFPFENKEYVILTNFYKDIYWMPHGVLEF